MFDIRLNLVDAEYNYSNSYNSAVIRNGTTLVFRQGTMVFPSRTINFELCFLKLIYTWHVVGIPRCNTAKNKTATKNKNKQNNNKAQEKQTNKQKANCFRHFRFISHLIVRSFVHCNTRVCRMKKKQKLDCNYWCQLNLRTWGGELLCDF